MKIPYTPIKKPRKLFSNFDELVELVKNSYSGDGIIADNYTVFGISKKKDFICPVIVHPSNDEILQLSLSYLPKNDQVDSYTEINEVNFEDVMSIMDIFIVSDSELMKFVIDS